MLTMKNFLAAAASTLFALFAISVSAQSADNGRFLSLTPPDGLPIIPVLEGWIDNQDGTTSFSFGIINRNEDCLLYTSPSPRDATLSRMPSSA